MRNYKKEYENYHSRPEQKIRRAARNAARRLFADADPDKDVHHKDNNPLNNDKNNLSLVTQHYNRREPRLRLRGEESALVLPTGGAVDSHIILKFQEILRKAGFAKKQKLAKEFGVKLSKRGKKYTVEGIDADAMIDLMQKYLLTKNKKEKKVLLKQINIYQRKLGLAVTEDMGTVTGPHIAGTGDDSSTVVVKKEKEKETSRSYERKR